MVYTFDDAKAESRHKVQYFEMIGNRAIYADGWFAGTIHKAPWEAKPRAALLDDKWELYDTRNDFSLANDLAAQNPAKLKELQDLFMKEAVKYNVLPIDDRSIERLNPKLAGRPDLMGDRTSLTLYAGMTGMSENAFINVKNRSLDDHRRRRDSGRRRQRRHPRAGRTVRRVEPVPEGRQADLRLQLPRPAAVHRRLHAGRARGQGHDPLRVRLRRRRPGQGRPGHDLRERQEGRRRADRAHAAHAVLARRCGGCGHRRGHAGDRGLQADDSAFTGKILKVTVDVKEMGAGEKAAAAAGAAEAARKMEVAK